MVFSMLGGYRLIFSLTFILKISEVRTNSDSGFYHLLTISAIFHFTGFIYQNLSVYSHMLSHACYTYLNTHNWILTTTRSQIRIKRAHSDFKMSKPDQKLRTILDHFLSKFRFSVTKIPHNHVPDKENDPLTYTPTIQTTKFQHESRDLDFKFLVPRAGNPTHWPISSSKTLSMKYQYVSPPPP